MGNLSLGTALLALVVLTGCGTPQAAPVATARPVAPAAMTPSPSSGPGGPWLCTDGDPLAGQQDRKALPAGFRPVSAYVCGGDTELVPGDGRWSVAIQQRADSGLEPLVAALRLPDLKSKPGTACTLQFDGDGELWLIDAGGQIVRPRWPRDGCHHLRPQTVAAVAALEFADTQRRRLEQVEPEQAIASGCATGWKNMVSIDGPGAKEAGTFAALGSARERTVCRFRGAPADQDGRFVAGHRADDQGWTTLVQQLEASGPAVACTRQSGDFVVVGLEAYVELDGCHRVLTPDGGLRQASPELLDRLQGMLKG